MKSIEHILIFEQYYRVAGYQNQPIKHFILIPNMTFKQVELSKAIKYFYKINLFTDVIIYHTYFITNEMDTITLSAIEWFSPNKCNSPYLNILNIFNKTTLTWSTKLKNYEKFLNYHGCELVLLLSAVLEDKTILDVSGYTFPFNQTNIRIYGLTPAIFEIASKAYNFKPAYQPAKIDVSFFSYRNGGMVEPFPVNGTIKQVHVYLHMMNLHDLEKFYVRHTNLVTNLDYVLYVTPAEKYTPYEKFFLPFDFETWLFLGITFILTFLCITVINRLSKSTQSLVYGHKVDTPFWNVVSIFFGISQTKLPAKNFPRFILMMFIYFCYFELVFKISSLSS
jgi:hypothetical protein